MTGTTTTYVLQVLDDVEMVLGFFEAITHLFNGLADNKVFGDLCPQVSSQLTARVSLLFAVTVAGSRRLGPAPDNL